MAFVPSLPPLELDVPSRVEFVHVIIFLLTIYIITHNIYPLEFGILKTLCLWGENPKFQWISYLKFNLLMEYISFNRETCNC